MSSAESIYCAQFQGSWESLSVETQACLQNLYNFDVRAIHILGNELTETIENSNNVSNVKNLFIHCIQDILKKFK